MGLGVRRVRGLWVEGFGGFWDYGFRLFRGLGVHVFPQTASSCMGSGGFDRGAGGLDPAPGGRVTTCICCYNAIFAHKPITLLSVFEGTPHEVCIIAANAGSHSAARRRVQSTGPSIKTARTHTAGSCLGKYMNP
jgi:hypothetical protein